MRKCLVALIFLLGGITSGFAQLTIRGSVTDSDGTPLNGATVLLKGTGDATTVGDDGTYRIEVKDNQSVLIFSFIGSACSLTL